MWGGGWGGSGKGFGWVGGGGGASISEPVTERALTDTLHPHPRPLPLSEKMRQLGREVNTIPTVQVPPLKILPVDEMLPIGILLILCLRLFLDPPYLNE